jgi:hypothetical protein
MILNCSQRNYKAKNAENEQKKKLKTFPEANDDEKKGKRINENFNQMTLEVDFCRVLHRAVFIRTSKNALKKAKTDLKFRMCGR